MAGGGCFSRLLRCVAEVALSLSGPATRVAGSVPAAAVLVAVLVGVYEMVIGSVYITENWRFYFGMRGLVQTAGCLAFLAAFANAALIFGVFRRNSAYLQNILSAVLAVYFLCAPLCLAVIIGLSYNTCWAFQLWEVPRILTYPLHMSLLYCLLAEVRRQSAAAETPADGWLKNNLASAGHAALGADGVLLKVHGDGLAPPARTHASGPLSSSEA